MRSICLLALLTLVSIHVTLFAAATNPDYAAEGELWWSRIKILADDNMEGRNTGSEGYKRAAAYVAAEFAKLGLKPAGTLNYYQPVKFSVRQINEAQSKLELIHEGDKPAETLSLSDDANLGLPADLTERTDGRTVFVGHGLVIPELGIDDLAGLDLKGKVAVVLSGGPPEIPGPLKAHYSHRREMWKSLQKSGAVGVATIGNPKASDVPWERATLARLQPVMSLALPTLDDTPGLKFSARINPARADKFFVGTGHTFTELLALAEAGKPLPKFPLHVSVRARVSARISAVASMNVAAMFPGNDPKLKDQYVVLSAHLDHLGIGQPINGDNIYNGAMDNASGVSSILEIARLLKESGAAPGRSILFLAVTGEEKGLQGSKYFANYPTIPKASIVANLNTDMFLPIHPLSTVVIFGGDESTLGEQARAICSNMGIPVLPDPEPNRMIFVRSDQYSFIRQGVPALSFKIAATPNSPEHQLEKDWLKNRYHAPSDDLNQPVDKVAAARFNRLMLAITQKITDSPEVPQWNTNSFFRRFAK